MPEASGEIGNLGTNPSGVGAYIFNPTVDPLTLHLNNLGLIQQGQDRRIAADAQHLKNLQDLAGAQDLDSNGIRPYDAEPLRQQGADVQLKLAKFYQTGGDLRNPAAASALSDYKNALNSLQLNINASKDANSKLASVYNTVSADKGDKLDLAAISQNYVKAMTKPVSQLGDINWTDMIVPEKDTDVAGAMKEWSDTLPTQESSTAQPVNGFMQTTTTKTHITDKDIDALATGYKGTKWANTIDNSWDALPVKKQSIYLNQALPLTGGNTTAAIDKARELYVRDMAKQQQMKQQTIAIHGETEASKMAAKKQGGEYAEWPHMLAAAYTGDPSIMGPVPYSPPLTAEQNRNNNTIYNLAQSQGKSVQDFLKDNPTYKIQSAPKAQVYGSTFLNNLNLGKANIQVPEVDKSGNIIPGAYTVKEEPNYPTMTYIDKNGAVHMTTVQSEELYRQGLQPSPDAKVYNSYREMLYDIGNTIPKSSKEEGLDPLTSMKAEVERTGANKPNGDIDPYILNPMDANKKALRSQKAHGFVSYEPLPTVGPAATTTAPPPPPKGGTGAGGTPTEKLYVLNGKAYKESVLKKQGYDVTKLQAYTP